MATAAKSFAVGDTVSLKSSGPVMTVHSVPKAMAPSYTCQWFAGKKLERGQFQFEELQRAEPQPPISTPVGDKKA